MFGKLFGEKKKPLQVPPLSSAIEQAILATVGAWAIPPMPGAAQKAFRLATDPNAEARDFIDVIEGDEALSARIIKVANSVYFDRGAKPRTIEDAVQVIGVNELRSLLSATSLSEVFPSGLSLRRNLWGHDVAVAIVARQIARRTAPHLAEVAFLGGLMHDLGKLLLVQRIGDQYRRIVEEVERSGKSFAEVEAAAYPFDHRDVGQLIGQRWRFTPELLSAIKLHHTPTEPTSLATIVWGADLIAHGAGLGCSFGSFRTRAGEQLPIVWEKFSIPASEQREFLSVCERSVTAEQDLYSPRSGAR